MARFITVHVGCDWADCDAVAEETNGEIVEKTVALDGKQAKAFLLCKEHLTQFEAVVEPLLLKGIKVEAPTKRQRSAAGSSTRSAETSVTSGAVDEQLECLDCHRKLKNNTGLAQHVIRTHGYEDLAAYQAKHGLA